MFSFAPFKPLGSAGNGAMLVTNDDAHPRPILRLLVGYGYDPAGDITRGYQNYVAEGYNVPWTACKPRSCWSSCRIAARLDRSTPRHRRRPGSRTGRCAASSRRASAPNPRPPSAPTPSEAPATALHCTTAAPSRHRSGHPLRPAHLSLTMSTPTPSPIATSLPVTDMLARQIVNLPVTPELTDDEVELYD